MKNDSEIIACIMGLIYPIIIVLGFYIIINGHDSPGGGFQGGAVLATVFITRYLVSPISDFRLKSLQLLEKILFICIVIVPVLYLFINTNPMPESFNIIYMITINFLIGVKVCCGLTVIFFRFVFYEGR